MRLVPCRLVILLDQPRDLYRAHFTQTARYSVEAATLCYSLAQLDEQGTILEKWRSFLEEILLAGMVDVTKRSRDELAIIRENMTSVIAMEASA